MIQSRTLTISGYEKRIINAYKAYYVPGAKWGIKIALLIRSWELEGVAKRRFYEAVRRLHKRGVILRSFSNGKETQGSYRYNINYKPKTKK